VQICRRKSKYEEIQIWTEDEISSHMDICYLRQVTKSQVIYSVFKISVEAWAVAHNFPSLEPLVFSFHFQYIKQECWTPCVCTTLLRLVKPYEAGDSDVNAIMVDQSLCPAMKMLIFL